MLPNHIDSTKNDVHPLVQTCLNDIANATTALAALETRVKELTDTVQHKEVLIMALLNNATQALSTATWRSSPLTQADKVYKEECVVTFATPLSPGGLFVNLNTLQAYSRHQVLGDWNRTGRNCVYLVQRWEEVEEDDDNDNKQPTMEKEPPPKKLAIGMDGGFLPDFGKKKPINKFISLAIGPHFDEQFPVEGAPQGLKTLVNAVLARDDVAKEADVMAWEAGSDLAVSKYAMNLVQLNNGVRISHDPATWSCADSGLRENLWLNLSTGYIGSGRPNWQGSGGTGAALKHFNDTGSAFPLAVKLGTITADGKADVYSYAPDEDTMVLDPLLKQHLAHFGLDVNRLTKTDKTLAEMEVDLNASHDWAKISQEGVELQKLNGSWCVGLVNTGNSCYCNSVYQTLFAFPNWRARFARGIAASGGGEGGGDVPREPQRDLLFQFQKLGNALADPQHNVRPLLPPSSNRRPGKGKEEEDVADVVTPRMLKNLLGERHVDFSSSKQQDATEYLQYVLDRISTAAGSRGEQDPATWFKYYFEERLECMQSHQVRYTYVCQPLLELKVPYDPPVLVPGAVTAAGAPPVPRGVVSLDECLRATLGPQACNMVTDYLSPVTGQKGIAVTTAKMATFPKYLLIRLMRFKVDAMDVMATNAVKMDCSIPAPLKLNLREFKGTGLKEGEEIALPDSSSSSGGFEDTFMPDDTIVAAIKGLGLTTNAAVKAAKAGANNLELATMWALEHSQDKDIDGAPTFVVGNRRSGASEPAITQEAFGLAEMLGVGPDVAQFALSKFQGNTERAADWILTTPEGDVRMEMAAGGGGGSERGHEKKNDGQSMTQYSKLDSEDKNASPQYFLKAVISHVGKDVHAGHYVAHVNHAKSSKETPRWVFFNDDKVALAEKPELDLGFLLAYERED